MNPKTLGEWVKFYLIFWTSVTAISTELLSWPRVCNEVTRAELEEEEEEEKDAT